MDNNIFDEDTNPPPPPQAAPSPQVVPPVAPAEPGQQRVIIRTPAAPPPDLFATDTDPPPPKPPPDPNAIDWASLNKPRGELRPSSQSYTEAAKSLGQDALIGLGADPYRARHLSEGLVDLSGFTPMGSVLSGLDFTYHAPKALGIGGDAGNSKMRNLGNAALDVVGAIPGAQQVRRGIQAARGTLPTTRMADTPTAIRNPTTGVVDSELGTSARGHYDAVARAPIDFHPTAMPNVTDAVRMALQHPDYGAFTPEAARGVHDLLARRGQEFANRISTPRDYDVLRQQLRAFTEGPDSAAGRRAADFIDQFLQNPPAGSVLRSAPGALDTMRRRQAAARSDYRAHKTSEIFDYAIDRAGTRTGTQHSALNLDNNTRQALFALTDPPPGVPSKAFGATYPEMQQFRDVQAGDRLTNWMRYRGNRMGGGGGIGGSLMGGTTGFTLNHLLGSWGIDPVAATAASASVGYAWPKVGEAFRRGANARTVRAAEEAVANVRRNSALYRERELASPDIVDPFAMQRDAVAYALIPPAVRSGREKWDESFVPYENR